MARACLLRVNVQLLRLPGRLTTRSGDDEHILEAVLVESLASGLDGYFSFLMGYVLRFAVGPLNEDARYMSLFESSKVSQSDLIIFDLNG